MKNANNLIKDLSSPKDTFKENLSCGTSENFV